MWKKGHYAKVCRQNYTNNLSVKRPPEEDNDDRNETSSESDESIHHKKYFILYSFPFHGYLSLRIKRGAISQFLN